MKKLQLLFCAVALIMISCTLSNEEKAEKLIQESLKGTLYHPESYKSISTQVDSAFINFENLAKVGELCEELGDLLDKESEYQREYFDETPEQKVVDLDFSKKKTEPNKLTSEDLTFTKEEESVIREVIQEYLG